MAISPSTDTYGTKSGSTGSTGSSGNMGTDSYKSDSTTPGRSTSDSGYSSGSDYKSSSEHYGEAAKDKLANVKDKAKEKLDEAADAAGTIKDLVTQNPVTALGVAAALGLLLGLAFIRPRS